MKNLINVLSESLEVTYLFLDKFKVFHVLIILEIIIFVLGILY
jgi:hypothetical protein